MQLLTIVQRVLSAMNDMNVASIGDTKEAGQVANLVRRAYEEIIMNPPDGEYSWWWLRTSGPLEPHSDANKLEFPTNFDHLISLKVANNSSPYNDFKRVIYLEPAAFNELMIRRASSSDVVDANGIVNNKRPTYWTTFDQKVLEFDSYENSSITPALSNSVYWYTPETPQDDEDIPDMPERFHNILVDMAIVLALEEIKRDQFSFMYQRASIRAEKGIINLKTLGSSYKTKNKQDKINYGRRV